MMASRNLRLLFRHARKPNWIVLCLGASSFLFPGAELGRDWEEKKS